MSQVHAQARTTPRTRAEIKASSASIAELADRYNINRATARKWKHRDSPDDLSHRPHTLHTTLSPVQEAIAVELRRLLFLPLDDLLAVVREFVNPQVSRAGLDRCLRRHGVSSLRELQAQAQADAGTADKPVKTFKDYEPGFVHVDIKYLPQMPDERQRRYLFVAIDRATRWVFMHIYADQSEDSSVDFLERLERAAPMKIVKLLTDNGSQFTDRFTNKKREPSGRHKFDVRCKALGIEHRLCPPRHPQTNGMVERFNGRISEIVRQTRFASAAQLEATLMNYLQTYNHHIPQRALKHVSPVQALKDWYAKKPELFKKRVYKQAGLDSLQVSLAGDLGDGEPYTVTVPLGPSLRGQLDAFNLQALALRGETPSAMSVRASSRAALLHLRALQALDGLQAGASHRKIAHALFGAETVAQRWQADGELRAQVRHLLRRAEAYMHGGYRALAGVEHTAAQHPGDEPVR